MANNRMYLVNKYTGDKILLGKYYPNSYNAEVDYDDLHRFFKEQEGRLYELEHEFGENIIYSVETPYIILYQFSNDDLSLDVDEFKPIREYEKED